MPRHCSFALDAGVLAGFRKCVDAEPEPDPTALQVALSYLPATTAALIATVLCAVAAVAVMLQLNARTEPSERASRNYDLKRADTKTYDVPGLGAVSFGASWDRRLQLAAVFTFSLDLLPYALLLSVCLLGTLTYLVFPAPLVLGYLAWAYCLDASPVTGGRPPRLRNLAWWHRYADYFPLTLVKTADLDPEGVYVLGYHPHGIISCGAFGAFATSGARTLDLTEPEMPTSPGHSAKRPRGFSSLFPGLDPRLVTLPINFQIPLLREYILSLGLVNSKAQTFRHVLRRGAGSVLVVVVGGAEESLMVHEHGMDLVLEKRKGFVREAIAMGASLVPVLAYGENDLYAAIHPDATGWVAYLQRAFKRKMGVAPPLFRGRSFFLKDLGLLPRRTPINVVVGGPIPPPSLSDEQRRAFRPKFDRVSNEPLNDDAKLVAEMHHRYVEALLALYKNTKDAPWNRPGMERQASLMIKQ